MKEKFNFDLADYVCDKCGGTGKMTKPNYRYHSKWGVGIRKIICDQCNGTGRLDWIENVKKQKTKR
jgi:DnaJ-class molecular chaperone